MLAFGIGAGQIKGPDFLDNRYDVVALVPPNTEPLQVELMLRNLLIERFETHSHFDNKIMPVYALETMGLESKLEPCRMALLTASRAVVARSPRRRGLHLPRLPRSDDVRRSGSSHYRTRTGLFRQTRC